MFKTIHTAKTYTHYEGSETTKKCGPFEPKRSVIKMLQDVNIKSKIAVAKQQSTGRVTFHQHSCS
jgi:hypothetical protein